MGKLILGDCLEVMKTIESNSVSCIVTSPPYNKKGLIGKVKPGNQVWKKFNIDYDSYGDDLSEEDYHKQLRKDANDKEQLVKKYCTDPEWNPDFNPDLYENILPCDFP
jgi:DNA modification methylase